MWQLAIGLSLVFVFSGCGSEDLSVYQIPKTESKASSQGAENSSMTQSHAGHVHRPFDFDLPKAWEEQAATGMRLVSFKVAVGENSLDGSLVQLGAGAGEVVSNVNRWRGQVGLDPAEGKDIMAELKEFDSGLGKFKYFKLVNPEKPESAILVGMYNLDQVVLFAKIMGPMEGILSQETAFMDFCKSLRPHQH
jgi:hypothetical protein